MGIYSKINFTSFFPSLIKCSGQYKDPLVANILQERPFLFTKKAHFTLEYGSVRVAIL